MDRPTLGQRAADAITAFSGSWAFMGLHAVWWVSWWALRLSVDLLTLWVSLEAIVLGSLMLMSQALADKKRDETLRVIYELLQREQQNIEDLEEHLG